MIWDINKKIANVYKKKIDAIKKDVVAYITEEEFKKIEAIIHSAASAAAAASGAMAQGATLGIDTPVLISIHIAMVITIGKIFGESITQSSAAAILGTASGVGIGLLGAKAILGLIPMAGNVVNASVSFFYTELLGWMSVQYFKGNKKTVTLTLEERESDFLNRNVIDKIVPVQTNFYRNDWTKVLYVIE